MILHKNFDSIKFINKIQTWIVLIKIGQKTRFN